MAAILLRPQYVKAYWYVIMYVTTILQILFSNLCVVLFFSGVVQINRPKKTSSESLSPRKFGCGIDLTKIDTMGHDKMADVLWAKFLNSFSCIIMVVFLFKFNWNMFRMV